MRRFLIRDVYASWNGTRHGPNLGDWLAIFRDCRASVASTPRSCRRHAHLMHESSLSGQVRKRWPDRVVVTGFPQLRTRRGWFPDGFSMRSSRPENSKYLSCTKNGINLHQHENCPLPIPIRQELTEGKSIVHRRSRNLQWANDDGEFQGTHQR